MGHVKQKVAFEHVSNVQFQMILRKRKVSSGPLLSSHLFCSIQWIC